jgi:hypothetical protein
LGAALLVVACGGGDRRPADAGARLPSTMRGPDAVLLRVPRAGGRVSAVVYPRLDSVVWRSGEAAPALARVLDFDAEGGVLAAVDTGGRPVRVDLRLGTARRASTARLAAITAAGGTFYGVDTGGAVTRLTTAGAPWRVRLTPAPQALLPQRDGTVLAAGSRGGTGVLWVLRPPAAGATDSVRVPGGARPVGLAASDRVYFAGGDELLAVQARTLAAAAPIALGAELRAAPRPRAATGCTCSRAPGRAAGVDRYAGCGARDAAAPRRRARDPRRPARPLPARAPRARRLGVGGRRGHRARGRGRAPARRAELRRAPRMRRARRVGDDVVSGVDGRDAPAAGDGHRWRLGLLHLVIWNGSVRARPASTAGAQASARPARRTSAPQPTRVADGTADADSDTTAERPPSRRPARAPRPPRAHRAAARRRAPPCPAADAVAARRGGRARARPPRRPQARRRARASRATRGVTVQFAAAPTEEEARRTLARLRVPTSRCASSRAPSTGASSTASSRGPFATRAEAERAARRGRPGTTGFTEGAP